MNLSFTQTINGKPNYFIEKIWSGLDPMITPDYYCFNEDYVNKFVNHWDGAWTNTTETNFPPKLHTIREYRRTKTGELSPKQWKAGDKIHMCINPRQKNYFQFAPVVKCVSVQTIEIKHELYKDGDFAVNFRKTFVDGIELYQPDLQNIAINDGFDSIEDFYLYFDKNFTGVIIHWTNLKY